MESRALPLVRIELRSFALSSRVVLAGMVVLDATVRFLSSLGRPTVDLLPDEYTYSALAHAIATTGHPAIRDAGTRFPALLEPLLAAPGWLGGDPSFAYRFAQAENAVLVSLAAVPVYLLCRRLALGRWIGLSCAALALLSPNLLYASFVTSEAVAYPLVLGAVYAAVVALETPSAKAQLGLLTLVSLASFARLQYLLLLPVVVVAALVVERGNVRRAAAKCRVVLAALACVLVCLAVLGPGRLLGVYGSLAHTHVALFPLLRQLGTHLVLTAFASGVVLLPGAVLGLGLALGRARPAAERAFAAIVLLLAAGLLAEAIYVGGTISGNYEERYLMCLFPLLPLAFAVYAKTGGRRLVTVLMAGGLALLAMREQISSYVASGWDSTFLSAAMKAEGSLGNADGALLFSVAALLLSIAAAFVAQRPRRRLWLAFALAAVVQVSVGTAAISWDAGDARWNRHVALPADARWIDHSDLGRVTLVQLRENDTHAALQQLFWNTSLARVVLLPGATRVDSYANPSVRIARDGGLVGKTGRVRGPLLVDTGHTWVAFTDARRIRRFHGYADIAYDLWEPTGPYARIAAEAHGITAGGWLYTTGTLTVWPSHGERKLILHLAVPAAAKRDTVNFVVGGRHREVAIDPGRARTITFTVPPRTTPWTLRWSCDRFSFLASGQRVSMRARQPRLVDG